MIKTSLPESRSRFQVLTKIVLVCWVMLSLIFLLQPHAFSPGISFPDALSLASIDRFWTANPSGSLIHISLHVMAIVSAIFMIALVLALSGTAPGLFHRIVDIVVVAGQGIQIFSNIRYLSLERFYSHMYVDAPQAIRQNMAISTMTFTIDPYGVLEYGGVALWIIAVVVIARKLMPAFAGFAVAGCISAAGFLCMIAGSLFMPVLHDIAPILGIPVFCLWLRMLYTNAEHFIAIPSSRAEN